MITIEAFVRFLDLGGTFVFAISGAVAAIRRLDIFGILVLSFVAGNLGGIGRDLLIGAAPPAAAAKIPLSLEPRVANATVGCFPPHRPSVAPPGRRSNQKRLSTRVLGRQYLVLFEIEG